ncbi:non-specific lipid transfer protein GPI-anchored 5-like [Rhododendron vialii]|uniref:non-specific lipid transfer protein GPI-anchored 5-like n=1 Tax=Rhododendron vialii TaxID=182163 RepID=UPI00265FD185|nr:non-specific lipid transfer protein GPI-anchored 5-like [Rhododendron vialii]
MARQAIGFGLVLVAVSVLWAGAAAQSSSSCTNALINMAPCLNYINGNSSNPPSGCCTQLSNVVESQPKCLCQALNGGGSLGITVNQTRALELPKVCKVETPSSSNCNGASPTGSSSGTPASPTTKTPTTSPSGTGSKAVPSTDSSSSPSDSSSTKMTVSLSFVLLFIASYFSTSTIC